MTGYESKKAAAIAKTIDEVNWADHEPNGVTQPAQEPAAWIAEFENGEQELHFEEPSVGETITPLYTTPPQRPWAGLTLDEIVQIGVATGLERAAVDMISNKLKEKNT